MDKIEIEDFLKFAKESVKKSPVNFTYQSYIAPHSEMRELLGKIIQEFQYLEKRMNDLIKFAVEKNIYKGETKFNLDDYIPASRIINGLRENLIDNEIADKLLAIIKFRNYVIHEYYLHDDCFEIENSFPDFLFMIFEANDYIENAINKITGNGVVHIRNVFDTK